MVVVVMSCEGRCGGGSRVRVAAARVIWSRERDERLMMMGVCLFVR